MPTTKTKAGSSSSGRGSAGSKAGARGKSGAATKSGSNGSASGRAWKLERASVKRKGEERPRSNKYSESDSDERPAPGERTRAWVGGYTRADGRKVKGHYRELVTAGASGSSSRGKATTGGSAGSKSGKGR